MRKIFLEEYRTWSWECPNCNKYNSEAKIFDETQCQGCFKVFEIENKTEKITEISVCAKCGHQTSKGSMICHGCDKKNPEVKFIQFK